MPKAKREKLPDTISIIWSIADVQEVRPKLSKTKCREILQEVLRQHNAELGVTWETIESVADELFPRP